QILEIVLEGETPIEYPWLRVHGDSQPERAGHRERFDVAQAVGQVTQALAEEQRGREGRGGLGPHALLPGSADVDVDAAGDDQLVLRTLHEDVLEPDRHVVEAGDGGPVAGSVENHRGAEGQPEV